MGKVYVVSTETKAGDGRFLAVAVCEDTCGHPKCRERREKALLDTGGRLVTWSDLGLARVAAEQQNRARHDHGFRVEEAGSGWRAFKNKDKDEASAARAAGRWFPTLKEARKDGERRRDSTPKGVEARPMCPTCYNRFVEHATEPGREPLRTCRCSHWRWVPDPAREGGGPPTGHWERKPKFARGGLGAAAGARGGRRGGVRHGRRAGVQAAPARRAPDPAAGRSGRAPLSGRRGRLEGVRAGHGAPVRLGALLKLFGVRRGRIKGRRGGGGEGQMSFATLSMRQALAVWSELEQAYHGTNRYGGDVAEVYEYSVQSRSPAVENAEGQTAAMARMQQSYDAKAALADLFREFEVQRDCQIEVDGRGVADWRDMPPNGHRYNVRVLHKARGGG